MRIIADSRKIERNHKIGTYSMIAGMVVLLAGLFISISQITTGMQASAAPTPEAERMLNLATAAMFGGLILTEISMYFNNRWGRKPYIEEKVSLGLKGLDDRYSLYHHKSPVPSLLIGPAGIWVLTTLYQKGTITVDKERLRQRGISWFSRVFYQEGIGHPEGVARIQAEDMRRFMAKQGLDPQDYPPVQAAIVFTSPAAVVQVSENEAAIPAMHVEKLKDFIRRKAKENTGKVPDYSGLLGVLPEE